jgi:4-hydroxy-2-oxoheptanedioate aldolase
MRSYGPVRSFYAAGARQLEPLCLAMIETATAIANLEAIADTPGIDGLFVGPVDLALSLGMGLDEALTLPDAVLAAIDRVVAICASRGLIAGCPGFGLEGARKLVGRGIGFVTVSSDVGLLRRGAAQDVAQARALADEYAAQGAAQTVSST